MSDDLVKRLQGWARDIQVGSTTIWAMDQDLKEAADSIEELEKTLALRTCEADAKALIVSGLEAKLKAITERNDLVEYANVELGEKLAKAVEERDEAIRRRDAWKSKAEGYDAVRKALREKVGAPWPPNLSRALWAGIAADEKKRADDAEAKLAKAVEVGNKMAHSIEGNYYLPGVVKEWRTTLAELKGGKDE